MSLARSSIPVLSVGLLLFLFLTPTAAASHTISHRITELADGLNGLRERVAGITCLSILNPTACEFLADPLGVIFGGIAYAISVPLLWLSGAISTVYGWLSDAILALWNMLGAPFRFISDGLRGLEPLVEDLARRTSAAHSGLAARLDVLGPLAPVALVIIDFAIIAGSVLTIELAVRAGAAAVTGGISEAKGK